MRAGAPDESAAAPPSLRVEEDRSECAPQGAVQAAPRWSATKASRHNRSLDQGWSAAESHLPRGLPRARRHSPVSRQGRSRHGPRPARTRRSRPECRPAPTWASRAHRGPASRRARTEPARSGQSRSGGENDPARPPSGLQAIAETVGTGCGGVNLPSSNRDAAHTKTAAFRPPHRSSWYRRACVRQPSC